MNKRIITFSLWILIAGTFLSCEGPFFIIPRDPDTTPPSATMVNPPHGATLSGDVLIEVNAEDNDGIDSVEFFINDILVTVDLDSPYFYIWSTLDTLYFDADTLYSTEDSTARIISKITDHSENYRYTDPILITIDNYDNNPPSGEFVDLYWGKTVQGVVPLIVSATDDEGVQSVTFYMDNVTLSIDPEEPYTYNWNTIELEDKAFTIRAIVEDLSENRSSVGPVQVIVDNIPDIDTTPPNVVITYPVAAQTVSELIIISAEATDNDAVHYVEFFINGESFFTDYDPPYSCIWNTLDPEMATEDTEHIIHVVAIDLSGNAASPTPITVLVDNTESEPPSVVITEPSAGQTVNGTVHISIVATDNVAIANIECTLNDELLFSDDSDPYTFEWNTLTIEDDTWQTLRVTATDINGISSISTPINVFVDNLDDVPPTGMIMNPYAGQVISGDVNIQIDASDNAGVESVQFTIDGNVVFTDTDYPYEYLWDTQHALEDNYHIISILVTDQTGNSTALPPISVYVDNNPTGDDSPPTVTIQYPLSGQTVYGTINIEVSALDNVGIDSISYIINEDVVYDGLYTPTYEWNTMTWGPNGDATIQIEVTDVSGYSAFAQPIYVIVDNSFDGAPGSVNAEATQPGQILIQWSSTMDAVFYRLYRNDSFLTETESLSYQDSDITPNNAYCYTVSAVNQFDIESERSPEVCSEDILPVVTNLTASALSDTEMSVSWSAVNSAGSYQLNVNGVPEDTTVSVSVTLTSLNDNTEYCYSIVALDLSDDPGITSDEVCETTHLTMTATTLSITTEPNTFNLTWISVPTAVDYHVYRDGTFLSQTDGLEYNDSSGDHGIEYCYYIIAVNEHGTSGPASNEVCDRLSLSAPSTVNVEAQSTTSILVNWTNVDGAATYQLYQNNNLIDANAVSPTTINGLNSNTQYCYYVIAVDIDGFEGNPSEEACATTHTDLTAPTLNIIVESTLLNLTWTSVPTAVEYHIYRDGSFLTQTGLTTYDDSSIDPGIEYCYYVIPVNEHGTSGPTSNEVCDRLSLSAPSTVNVEAQSTTSILVNWTNVDGAATYQLYQNNNLIDANAVSPTTINGLNSNTQYCYYVIAVDIDGFEGNPSEEACATTHTDLTAPTLNIIVESTLLSLSWTSVPTAIGYHIYRDGSFLAETDLLSYEDASIDPGIEYCYYIIAVNEHGTSGPASNEMCERLFVLPPSDFTATGGDQTIFLNWSETPGASTYTLYLSGNNGRDLVFLANTADTFYQHQGLGFETSHCYVIACVDADGFEGPVSLEECATTDPEPSPLPPTSLTVTQSGTDAELNWVSSVSDNIEFVLIYKNGEYTAAVDGNIQTYTDTLVTQGTEYCYSLIARSFSNTDSDPSSTACITIE